MRRGGIRLLIALVALVALSATPAGAVTTIPPPSGPTTTSPPPKAYILIDANTGAVLVGSDDRTPRRPASLTKVLTALAAASVLKQDGRLKISARAAAQPANKIGAKAGEVWPTSNAMHALLMESANDMAMAFAETAGGSAEGFQPLMARTAKSIGMTDPQTWRDPAGLDDEESVGGGNLVSARDLAIAGRALIAHPWLSPISAKPRSTFTTPTGATHQAINHNKLVLGRYPGAIGGKTGYTKKAGNSLLASAQRDGRTMLTVVLDAPDAYGFTTQLLDRGFATPVKAQQKLDHLPALRLPATTKATTKATTVPKVTVAPKASATTLAPATSTTATPATTAPRTTVTPVIPEVTIDQQLDQPVEALSIAPDLPSVEPATTPLSTLTVTQSEDRTGTVLVATGVAGVVFTLLGGLRRAERRRRNRPHRDQTIS